MEDIELKWNKVDFHGFVKEKLNSLQHRDSSLYYKVENLSTYPTIVKIADQGSVVFKGADVEAFLHRHSTA